MNPIDKFLNNITMYKLVNYGLFALAFYALIASFLGILTFKPLELAASFLILTIVCYIANIIFARLFRATTNDESSSITAVILFFLLWPSYEFRGLLIIAVAGVLAMASKFILAYKKKHIFNPAAIAAVLIACIGSGGLWWVATPIMIIPTLVLGLLVVRKIRRFAMVGAFILTSVLVFYLFVFMQKLNPVEELYTFFTSFPVVFFATIMLTEPLTTPPTRRLQLIYAVIVGILFSWQGPFPIVILTTELALVIGNLYTFAVSPKHRLYLHLLHKKELAKDTYEFTFPKPAFFNFKPGQYLEWTLPMGKSDLRGNRRYFTLSSSPTENEVKLGIRFNKPSSKFKEQLTKLSSNHTVVAGQLAGDFTLPDDTSKKLVFIAGGIGVTPFRSMVKFLIDKNQKRDIVFFYSNKTLDEIAYRDEFDKAADIGVKMIYLLTDTENAPKNWRGETGRISTQMVEKYVPDYGKRTYFISGPIAMVNSYKKLLRNLGIPQTAIITDYFPGF